MNENQAYELIRSVSKNGDFLLVSQETLLAAQQLPPEGKVKLYEQIRDESRRFESEWRDEFADKPGVSRSFLPATEDPFA